MEGIDSIIIGNEVTINSSKKRNVIGGDTRTTLRAVDGGCIIIGNNVGISNSTFVSKGEGIIIEDDVMIGGSCSIYDTDFHSIDYDNRMQKPDINIKTGKVLIKSGAFIGAKSIILKGVTIGCHSVVGAGSVVTRNVPDYEVWGGAPAKKIRMLR